MKCLLNPGDVFCIDHLGRTMPSLWTVDSNLSDLTHCGSCSKDDVIMYIGDCGHLHFDLYVVVLWNGRCCLLNKSWLYDFHIRRLVRG